MSQISPELPTLYGVESRPHSEHWVCLFELWGALAALISTAVFSTQTTGSLPVLPSTSLHSGWICKSVLFRSQ